jgi:hypothetical protein
VGNGDGGHWACAWGMVGDTAQTLSQFAVSRVLDGRVRNSVAGPLSAQQSVRFGK